MDTSESREKALHKTIDEFIERIQYISGRTFTAHEIHLMKEYILIVCENPDVKPVMIFV